MSGKPVWAVRGNCDLTKDVPEALTLVVEGATILLVHGHRQGVKHSLLRLGLYALEEEANLVLFGHTHVPVEELYEGATLYNPGSLGEPRGGKPTFGIVTVDAGVFRIKTYTL
jgi:putative phosphoesterase